MVAGSNATGCWAQLKRWVAVGTWLAAGVAGFALYWLVTRRPSTPVIPQWPAFMPASVPRAPSPFMPPQAYVAAQISASQQGISATPDGQSIPLPDRLLDGPF
jgi:hypothetical protein